MSGRAWFLYDMHNLHVERNIVINDIEHIYIYCIEKSRFFKKNGRSSISLRQVIIYT
jgi:hypothetical protein